MATAAEDPDDALLDKHIETKPRKCRSRSVKCCAVLLVIFVSVVVVRYFNVKSTCIQVASGEVCIPEQEWYEPWILSTTGAAIFVALLWNVFFFYIDYRAGYRQYVFLEKPEDRALRQKKLKTGPTDFASLVTSVDAVGQQIRVRIAEWLGPAKIGNLVSCCHGTWNTELIWYVAPELWVQEIISVENGQVLDANFDKSSLSKLNLSSITSQQFSLVQLDRRALLRSPWTRRFDTSNVETLRLFKRNDVECRIKKDSSGRVKSQRRFFITRHVTDALLVFVAGGWWGALRNLDLSMNDLISDAGISVVTKSLGPQLISLDISDCKRLTDKAVLSVSQSCFNLTRLCLNALEQISDASLLALSRIEDHENHNISLPQLTVFEANGCKRLTDVGLCALAQQHGSSLRVLEVNGCKMVTDVGVRSLIKCTDIMVLELGWIRELTDESVCALAKECKSLISLNLSGIRDITDKSLFALAQESSLNIRAINIYGCTMLTQEGQEHFLTAHKDAQLHGNGSHDYKNVSNTWLATRAAIIQSELDSLVHDELIDGLSRTTYVPFDDDSMAERRSSLSRQLNGLSRLTRRASDTYLTEQDYAVAMLGSPQAPSMDLPESKANVDSATEARTRRSSMPASLASKLPIKSTGSESKLARRRSFASAGKPSMNSGRGFVDTNAELHAHEGQRRSASNLLIKISRRMSRISSMSSNSSMRRSTSNFSQDISLQARLIAGKRETLSHVQERCRRLSSLAGVSWYVPDERVGAEIEQAVANGASAHSILKRPETYCSQIEDADIDTEWLSGYDVGAVVINFVSEKEICL